MDDRQILSDLYKGSESAFDSLFAKYYADLVCYAYGITSDRSVSEDLVQDFFIKFWQQKRYKSISTSLRHYLFFSIRNSCVNYLRDNKKTILLDDSIIFDDSEPDSDREDEEIVFRKIFNAMEKLPTERKKIFRLCFLHNMKYREVAELLGISINTVKVQIGRALKFLRENSFFL